MSLQLKYFTFLTILHAAIGVMAYFLLENNKWWFFAVEVGIIIFFILGILLYRSFIRPIKFMLQGANAIQDQDFNVKFVKIGSKEMDQLIDVYNQMIDNIREERIQVQEQHYFLQKLINASPAGIIILDFDEQITEINPQALEILEITNWKEKHITDFDQPLLNVLAQMPINTSQVVAVEGVEQYKVQCSQFVHQGFKRKFLMIQELSKEILEAEKRAYGKVIRMMAHEVNNSIGAINSILHSLTDFYLIDNGEFDDEIKESLQVAIDRNDRLNIFMKNFASVIRLPEPYKEQIDLNVLVQNIARLMEATAKEHYINIELELSEKPIFLKLDIRQIEQVLVNILKNAIEAIGKDGIIRLNTTHSPATLSILDNGEGIASENVDKLFTPFFSTKRTGQGVGLTLVREILINHETQFSLKSGDGWTRFEIRF